MRTGMPRRAQACPGAHSGRIVALGPAVSQAPAAVSQPHAVRPRAPSRACSSAALRARLARLRPSPVLPHPACRTPCAPSAPRLCRLLPAQCALTPAACAPPGRIMAWHGTVSQYSPALPSPLSCNIVQCIAIHCSLLPAPIYCNINQPVAMQFFPLGCNTKPVITIQSLLELATFQPPRLQYKPCLAIQKFYFHNIIWAVALPNLHLFFFFIFLVHSINL